MRQFERVLKSLGIVMALAYISTGIVILFQTATVFSIPKPLVMPVGLGLLAYGLFRSYRLYQKYFK